MVAKHNPDNVIIIGAGVSGIAAAAQLQMRFGKKDFEIYEKGHAFGGTWYHNTYPGCGCDVPSHFYSLSFAKNPDWSQYFPLQPEIHKYMVDVAHRFDLPRHTTFGQECILSEYNEYEGRWYCTFKDVDTKETYIKSAKFLIMCAGGLSVPNELDIPGYKSFKGDSFHSARWNHNVNLHDKDIVVIGNGCSATQFVPVILKKAKHLTQFIRSQHWILERPNPRYSSATKAVFRYVPGVMWMHRAMWAILLDAGFKMFETDGGQWLRNQFSKHARNYMQKTTPKKYWDLVIPTFEIGSKRRVFDTDYLPCLTSDKMELTNDKIVEITEHSVRTQSGREIHADVIVYANGFQIHAPLVPMTVKGRNGIDLRERWESQGGARAYMGLMVAGFPNMFITVGPNTASGHYSIIYMSEANVNMICKLMAPVLDATSPDRPVNTVEVTETAERKDVAWVQNRLRKMIWGNTKDGEAGWYIDRKTGHNGTVYPHYQFHYYLRTAWGPSWKDFNYVGYKRNYHIKSLMTMIVFLTGLIAWRRKIVLRGQEIGVWLTLGRQYLEHQIKSFFGRA